MKYFLFLFALALQTIGSAQGEKRTVDAGTAFGRHLADCSSGRGVCSFNVSSSSNAGTTDSRVATKLSKSSFKLTLSRNALTTADEYEIAGKAFSAIVPGEILVFVQEDDMTIDAATLSNLLLDPTRNRIVAGMYALSVYADRVEIVFTLSN